MDAQFSGCIAESDVVVVVEAGDGGDGAADVVGLGGVVEMFDRWVLGVAAEYFFGFFVSIGALGVI